VKALFSLLSFHTIQQVIYGSSVRIAWIRIPTEDIDIKRYVYTLTPTECLNKDIGIQSRNYLPLLLSIHNRGLVHGRAELAHNPTITSS